MKNKKTESQDIIMEKELGKLRIENRKILKQNQKLTDKLEKSNIKIQTLRKELKKTADVK